MATTFEAGVAGSYAVCKAVRSTFPGERNPDLDITFDCLDYDRFGNADQGVGRSFATAEGGLPFQPFEATAVSYGSASGTPIFGNAFTALAVSYATADGEMSLGIVTPGKGGMGFPESNFVRWSNIGSLDFTKGLDNVAGKGPLDAKGFVYAILKLDKSVICYCENAIIQMMPSGVFWGQKKLFKLGIENKLAVCGGPEDIHFCVCTDYNLYKISKQDGIKELGYKEFLSNLTCMVLTFDNELDLVYICDGITGYVYDIESDSLGQCAPNITGMYFRDGVKYITSPDTITNPSVTFTTDIYDFGTRKAKTMSRIEFNTDVGQDLECAIEFRTDYQGAFATTPWVPVNKSGVAYLPCYGHEFRFKFRMSTFEAFELDQVKFIGRIHDFYFLDSVRKEN